jgi:glycerol-3-phosphate dehydrogenase
MNDVHDSAQSSTATLAGIAGRSFDLLVVGGGINGTGIARDAAGRGLQTLLCEQHDLASHTSSASTKLIHGGVRYLEFYDFALVRKALREREVIINSAPHIVWPLQFVLPHEPHLRPAWMIRAGLFLYDHLARRRHLPGSSSIDLRKHPAGAALESRYRRGFVYSDGWADDARLVVLNAMDAHERGAQVATRTRCTALARVGTGWVATLQHACGAQAQINARAVVNAAGPWVERFLELTPVRSPYRPRMVKGSHIVVPRLFEHEYCYIFQSPDGRIVFAIPYENDFTLIGTTEVTFEGDLASPSISEAELDYLLQTANAHFNRGLGRSDVVWTYAGLRPLLAGADDSATSVSRDYVLELDRQGAALLSVFGGKLTTYRKLAEEVVDLLAPLLDCAGRAWTANATLPGGDMANADYAAFAAQAAARYPWLPASLHRRYCRAYGTRIDRLLQGTRALGDLGTEVLPGLHAREIEYLRRQEWAVSAEDILYRRSKLGVHLGAGATGPLDDWLAAHPVATTVAGSG